MEGIAATSLGHARAIEESGNYTRANPLGAPVPEGGEEEMRVQRSRRLYLSQIFEVAVSSTKTRPVRNGRRLIALQVIP